MATRVLHGIAIFEVSESASPKDHFCEVSLKYVGRFQTRRFFKYLFTDDWTDGHTDRQTPDIDQSQFKQARVTVHMHCIPPR